MRRFDFTTLDQKMKKSVSFPDHAAFFGSVAALAAGLCLPSSAAPSTAVVPTAEIGTAVKAATASASFGGGIALPFTTLSPLLFEQGWKSHGSSGGMEPDSDGWRAFDMHTSSLDGAPKVNGKVRFSEGGDGTVRGEWLATPEADAPLLELCVGGQMDLDPFLRGTLVVDGKKTPISAECEKMHIFRGPASVLSLRDASGAERLRVSFDSPTRFLLQDNRGWGGTTLTLRLFFAEGPVSGGHEYAIRASFATPEDGLLALSDGRPVEIEAGADWIPLANEPWIEEGSALDFTKVLPHHAPAGKHGRVVAVGDHFELAGRPGVPQRFYGVNICGDANIPSTPEAAERFAANLARIGYNSLRIHHHERALLAPGGKFKDRKIDDVLADPQGFDDTMPDPGAMDRFDALVAACVKHGIYVTTDLFVSRSWYTTWRSIGVDRDGCLPGTDNFKILCAFWEPAYTNLCKWSRNFLGHVNPYTGRSLADEPALCALALVNEGNLGNWGAAPLRALPGVQEAWDAWLLAHPDDAKLAGVEISAKAKSGEEPLKAPIPDDLYADDGETPAHRLSAAFAIFLADSETRLADRLRAFLRDELHCEAPLSSLSCWYNPVQYQMVREGFDYVDDHFYVDHPSFLGKSWQLPSRCPNTNPMKGSAAGARSVAFRRIAGKPFTITEWNYAGPGRYRGVGGIATGVIGALQDWSGMWRFAWSHGRGGVESPETKTMGYFDMSGDPLGLAAERAALCLFLRGDIAPLKAAYPVSLSESDLRDPSGGAPRCQANSWLWAAWQARLSVGVDSASREGGAAKKKSGKSKTRKGEDPYAALRRDSGAVKADLEKLGATKPGDGAVSIDKDTGTFLIDTPCTAGGFAESGSHAAGPISFALADAPATVWASSLDGKPLADSSHVLLTHLTDVQNSGIKYADSDLTILLGWGKLPHLMRRGSAEIALRAGAGDFTVYRLSPSGRRLGKVDAAADGGALRFTARTDIDKESATFLYEIVREGGDGGQETASPMNDPASGGEANSSSPFDGGQETASPLGGGLETASPLTEDAATVTATPVWGTALSFSAPTDLFFRLGAYTSAWKFRGAFGGARADGGRTFAIDMDTNGGDNIAVSALRFDGRATFSATADGGVAADWAVVPDRDGELSEVMLEARIPLGRLPNGIRVDGKTISFPESMPEKPHLYRGPASLVETLGPDGKPWFAVELPDSAQILVQDNRSWGSAVATLRLFFVQGKVEVGKTYALRATFRLPGSRLVLDEGDQVVMEAGPDWIPIAAAGKGEDWIEPGSALDFSATVPHHEPAGLYGRVVAVGDHFEFEGRPGEPVRFCGVNLVHGANTPSVDSADRLAANLARFGFNAVRIHHHERPLLAKGDAACLAIDPGAQDRFDALVAACIRHGLYITTDLYVSRAPISWRSVGIDRDGNMLKEHFKMSAMFHEGAYSNLCAWSRQFMLHVNPYTGRCLAEEPALATLALVNEGNLGNCGRDALLAIPGVVEAWEKWCAERGEAPRDLSALPADLYDGKKNEKSLANVFALFLADMETAFYRRFGSFVREELGCRALLSNLSSWYNPASYCLARSVFDYDDDHGYVDHPFFLGKQWSLPASHPGENPLLGGDAVPGLAWRRLFGKPFCVTEWNWAAPGKYRQASGLVMGALAARQDWAGMWRFAWSHDRPNAENPGSIRMRYFDLAADPTQCASERATVCLFLRGDMPPLPPEAHGAIEIDEAALRAGVGAAKRLAAPADAASGWENRIGVALSASDGGLETASPLAGASAGEANSSSPFGGGLETASPFGAAGGEANSSSPFDGPAGLVAQEPKRGTIAVATDRTAGGFAPSGDLSAGPVAFALEGAPAAVWATSVDGAPIVESSRILVSHVTDSRNTGATFDDAACRVWLDFGKTPVLARRGSAAVSVAVAPGDWKVWRLSTTGRRLETVPATYDADGGYVSFVARTDYDPSAATFFYELSRD